MIKKSGRNNKQTPASNDWLLLGLFLVALVPAVQAAPLVWDITPGDGAAISNGNGNWGNGAGNWNNGAGDATWNNATPDSATFGKGTNSLAPWVTSSVVTLTNAVTVGNMTFTNWNGTTNINYQITGNTVTFSGTPTIMTRSDGQISSTIAGTGFVKDGAGTLRIDANIASYASNIVVNGGTLQIGNASTGGDLGTGNITLSGASIFVIRKSGNTTFNNKVTGTTTGNVQFQLGGSSAPGSIITINKANDYVAVTSINPTTTAKYGAVKLGIANGLPTNTSVSLGNNGASVVTFDLNGFNQTLGSLATAAGGDTTKTIVTTGIGAPTLTVSGTNSTTFAGLLSGNLALVKGNTNTLTLTGVSTYTGNTTINGGTLKLGVGGSIGSTPQIAIAAGATLDVSSNAAYVLSTSTALKVSGSANGANINGSVGGTVSLGSQAITLNFDGANPALTVSQGQLVLNGNAFTINGPVLAAGNYVVITNSGNTISSSGSYTVTGTVISGTTASIVVSGDTVTLQLAAAPVDTVNSTVVATPATLPADNSATSAVTVTLKNSSNVALPGVGVNWTVSGSGNTVAPASSGLTDGSGQISFTVRSIKAEIKTVIVSVGALTFTNLLTFTNPIPANVLTWDPAHNATGSDGLGTWDTSTANWANSGTDIAWPNNGNDSAVFGTGGAPGSDYVVTLATPVSVGNLTFANTANQYQLTGQSVTLSNTPAINVAANGLISSPLTGSGFAKTGAGTLRIDGNATNFTDNITVSNGWLQIGNNGTGGSLGTGTITVMDGATFSVRRTGTLNFSNTLAGTFTSALGFQLNNSAVVILFKANTYTTAGGTYLQPTASGTSGTLKLGINNALPTSTAFSINQNGASRQTFDLAGYNQTLASLAGSGIATTAFITNSSVAACTLAVSGVATTTFNGTVTGNLNVEVDGSGSLTLSANNYSGATTVKGGTLVLQQPTLSTNSTVTVTNGVLNLAFALNQTNQVAALVLNGTNMAPGLYSAATESPYLAGTGSLLVVPVATINPNPPGLQVSYGLGTLSLAWPTNQGWILQSNSVSLTTPGAWFNYPADGSVGITNVTITVDQTKANVFYRMLKP